MTQPNITARDLIALSLLKAVGRKTIHQAIRLATRLNQSLESLMTSSTRDLLLQAAPGEDGAVHALSRCTAEQLEEADQILARCAPFGIRYWAEMEPGYPPFIKNALGTQTPPVLFYQGNEALLDDRGLAVVGTRRPTGEALEWARRAASFCAGEGHTVMSGGAAGIDLAAHQAALRADGSTVVILPEGLLAHDAHPAIRTGLQNGQALLLSEFLPSAGWKTHQAMTRNRTIAACANAVCVLEPREQGGSMYTAMQALDQDKPVFYWGGAVRDGFLPPHRLARPLTNGRGLAETAIGQAITGSGRSNPHQGELFT